MTGLLFSFHWGVGAVLFVAAVPGVLTQVKYAMQMYRWQRKQTPLERQTAYFNWMLTGDLFAKELRLFGWGPMFMNRYREARMQLRKEKFGIAIRRSIAAFAAQAGVVLVVVASYAFIAYRAVHGAITLGDMVMYFAAFQRGLANLQQVFGGLASLYEDGLFITNLYEFLDLKRNVKEPEHPRAFPKPIQSGIVFDRVGFQYPSDSRKVLDGISLNVRRGETVALVGANGSGKTTLIKLLCRLYDPTDGVIRLDGMDLREFDTAGLRREIGVVFQDYVRYNLTARENIWFGDLARPSDDQGIVAAARKSGAHNVLQRFDRGYDTMLGKWFEDGEELSTGEWQKLALARAFLRDAQIVILDEPTSAMDAKTEYEVFHKFRELSRGRTAIIISHRFSTVRMADRIFVVAGGRITESGTHDELLRAAGQYARLFETQAQFYR
jgi:ATP-binding cassette subfamily B protein